MKIRELSIYYFALLASFLMMVVSFPKTSFSQESEKADAPASLLELEEIQELRKSRRDAIFSLLKILENVTTRSVNANNDNVENTYSHNNRIASDVIRLLGEYRAVEAVEKLIKNISLCELRALHAVKPSLDLQILPPSTHPAVRALIHIGKPSVLAVMRCFKITDPQIETGEAELLAYVIARIEGKEAAIGLLQKELIGLGEQECNHLRYAIRYLKSSDIRRYVYDYNSFPSGFKSQESTTNQLVLVLFVAVVILAGIVIFLLLRRKK